MNLFNSITNAFKAKIQDMKEKKEFVRMVDEQTKPIKRAAYLEQMKKEAANFGKTKASLDAKANLPGQTKKPEDFGIADGLNNPMKFLPKSKLGDKQ